MSVRVMQSVWEQSQSTGSARMILLAIADCANDEGLAWPSLSTIATKANVDRRTVMRCLGKLEVSGELERVSHGGRSGNGGASNQYVVRPEVGHLPAPKVGASDPHLADSEVGASDTKVGANETKVGAQCPPNRKEPPEPRAFAAPPPKTATAAPLTFEVTDDMLAWASRNGITVDLKWETEKFLDHHAAKGSKMVDWQRAWNNWMRNSKDFNRNSRNADLDWEAQKEKDGLAPWNA